MTSVDRPPAQAPEPALLQALWVEIERRGDLPGLAHSIRAIVAAMHDDQANNLDMSHAVLADASLTNRVLRLANGAMYRMFGEVSTVSRAIMILGTQAIGNLAMASKVFEQVEATGRASAAARVECMRASLAGAIARELAHPKGGPALAEKAAVCASLFGLGSLLLAYYLPERWAGIEALAAQDAIPPDRACRSLFGVSLVDVSRACARRWGLPADLTRPLRDVDAHDPRASLDHDEWLAALAQVSLAAAQARVAGGAGEGIVGAAGGTGVRFGPHAAMLGIEPEELAAATRAAGEGLDLSRPTAAVPVAAARPADGVDRLRQGLHELQRAAHSAAPLQTLACLAMEVTHRALGLRRCAAFLRQPSVGRWVACAAVGELSLRLRGPTPASFPDLYEPDLFHDALAARAPTLVQTLHDRKAGERVPAWWCAGASIAPASLVFVPSFLEAHPIALIAGDWGRQPQAALDAAETQGLTAIGEVLADALRVQATALRRQHALPQRRPPD